MENLDEIREATKQYVADINALHRDFEKDAIKEVIDRGKQFMKDITKRSAEYVAEITAILAPGEEVEPEQQEGGE